LLAEENKGFYAVMRNFQHERITLAAMAAGEAQKALDITLEHVRSAVRFGEARCFDNAVVRIGWRERSPKQFLCAQFVHYIALAGTARAIDASKKCPCSKPMPPISPTK